MNLFLCKKRGFLVILVFSLIFIFWTSQTLFASIGTAPKMKRKVDNDMWLNDKYSRNRSKFNHNVNLLRRGRYEDEANATRYENFYFNVNLSDSLPVDREIPDTRFLSCKLKEYTVDAYKKTSVIISFYNEAKSTLIRTLTSIINRTPLDLLQEIILIDDFSDLDLINYTLAFTDHNLPFIKYFRNDRREGLIRSRNRGARLASGEYVMFLDSHCEVNVHWLEPLIARLSDYPFAAVSPIIDVINTDTLVYSASSGDLKGGFDFSLHFKWVGLSEEERELRNTDESVPFVSPAVAGGIFLIARSWFLQLGGFDEGLETWGGESLEISLKTWLCGGRIEICGCSRIGHIFRKKHPYTFPLGNSATFLRNSKRIAEVWLDDYKHFFYNARPLAYNVEAGDMAVVKEQHAKLKCRPFAWYLQNVFVELKIPSEDYIAYGELKHANNCLQIAVYKHKKRAFLGDCVDNANTKFYFHKNGVIGTAEYCLNISAKGRLFVDDCSAKSSVWHRFAGALVDTKTGKCLENIVGLTVEMALCRFGAPTQLWSFSVELQQL